MADGLSFLPGQKLSRCTCPGESHPGPMHADGTFVGRAAPEIDVFEAQVAGGQAHVSQSAQWAVSEGFLSSMVVFSFYCSSPSIMTMSGSMRRETIWRSTTRLLRTSTSTRVVCTSKRRL